MKANNNKNLLKRNIGTKPKENKMTKTRNTMMKSETNGNDKENEIKKGKKTKADNS